MKTIFLSIIASDHFKGLAFALFGGVARIYTYKGRLRLRDILSGLLAASFVGAVSVEFIHYYKLDSKLIGLSNLLSGFLHKEMITIITERFLAKLNKIGNKPNDL